MLWMPMVLLGDATADAGVGWIASVSDDWIPAALPVDATADAEVERIASVSDGAVQRIFSSDTVVIEGDPTDAIA
jgi:hypothetical protein